MLHRNEGWVGFESIVRDRIEMGCQTEERTELNYKKANKQ